MFRPVSTRGRGEKGGGGETFQQVWTDLNGLKRVSTGLDGLWRVSTGLDRSERVSGGGGGPGHSGGGPLNDSGEKYAVCFFDNNNTVEKH